MFEILGIDIILYYYGSPEWSLSFDLALVNFNNLLDFWKQNTEHTVPLIPDDCKFIHEDFQTTSQCAFEGCTITLNRHAHAQACILSTVSMKSIRLDFPFSTLH